MATRQTRNQAATKKTADGVNLSKSHSPKSTARKKVEAPRKRPTNATTEAVAKPAEVPSGTPPDAMRHDPVLDRRIIEGMLGDREALMAEMDAHGFDRAAVLRRAAELGLSEALIRQVMGVAADLAGERPGRKATPAALGARTCLCCDRVFLSAGPGNRLCMRCRGGDAGLALL